MACKNLIRYYMHHGTIFAFAPPTVALPILTIPKGYASKNVGINSIHFYPPYEEDIASRFNMVRISTQAAVKYANTQCSHYEDYRGNFS